MLCVCVWMLQRGHSGDGCVLASTLCKFDLRKGDLFVLSWARVRRVMWGGGSLSDGFRCERCDGTMQEADLAEDLVVDGETYKCVKSFCYLGDTLDGDGGADLAATA